MTPLLIGTAGSIALIAAIALVRRLGARGGFAPTRLVWSRGLALLCDHQGGVGFVFDQPGTDVPIRFDPGCFLHVRDGEVVWMRSIALPQFLDEALPLITARFTLATGDEDWSIPGSFDRADELLNDPRVLAWFCQNHDGRPHPKLHPLPIGLDFHTIAKGPKWGHLRTPPLVQEAQLNSILRAARPNAERLCRVQADFHFNMPHTRRWGETRSEIRELLRDNPVIDFQKLPLRRHRLWKRVARYAFVISPHGNGLDCHRTWEALALGCIVIVKRSSLDPLYQGLPVVIVDDWDEITTDNLRRWHEQHRDAFERPEVQEKLTNRYWIDRMRRITAERMA